MTDRETLSVTPWPAPEQRKRPRWRRRLVIGLLVMFALPILVVGVYRFVPPPITPLMVIRSLEGLPIKRHWVPYAAIAPNLVAAVMASEDERFCSHHGFDFGALDEAWRDYETRGRLRGASTISMQTAKNLFLWPEHSFLRKGLEAYLTVVIEALWPKRRILEVYLNIIEWGPGLYGADSAAQTYFLRPAAALTPRQAALLAAVLPNPLHWSPVTPSALVERRAAWTRARMNGFLGGCR